MVFRNHKEVFRILAVQTLQLRNVEGGQYGNGRHFGGDTDVELGLMSELFTTKLLRDEPWEQSSVDSVPETVCPKIWRARKKKKKQQ